MSLDFLGTICPGEVLHEGGCYTDSLDTGPLRRRLLFPSEHTTRDYPSPGLHVLSDDFCVCGVTYSVAFGRQGNVDRPAIGLLNSLLGNGTFNLPHCSERASSWYVEACTLSWGGGGTSKAE